jgi:hypothetical protein
MPIGQITLHQGAIRLCLSDLNETVAKFAATFEKMLADSFAGKPELQSSLAADVLLVVSMALGPEEPMQEASAGE